MRLAIGYIRVSSPTSAAEGLSLEAQETRIREWAQQNPYQLYEPIFIDSGKSGGKLTNRPAVQAAIELACKEHAVLVVWSLSRTFRSVRDAVLTLEKLHKCKADIVSLSEQIDTTTAIGEAIFNVIATFDQLWRQITGENTKMILSELRQEGKRNGRIPYGWQADKSRPETKIKKGQKRIVYPYLIENPQEQALIAEIQRLRAIGYSIAMIAKELKGRGIQTRSGTVWGLTQIKRILKRKVICYPSPLCRI